MGIRLYQFPTAFGLPNASPFCMKVETYMRMAGVAFEPRYGMYMMRAPKKKLPYIDDSGRVVADSHFIIEYLKSAYGDPLDAALTSTQRALGTAIRHLLEDSLYWPMLYARWIDDAGWPMTRQAFFSGLPAPLRAVVPLLARRGLRQQLYAQGIGRHSAGEIYRIGCADITALSELLGGQPYFLGAHPSSLDAGAYAFLANILDAPVDVPLRRTAQECANLRAYCERMRTRYYA